MLILIGGAPRAGKGIVSRRCLDAISVPVLSLDVLKMGLHHAVPEVGVEAGADPSEVGKRMWPLVRSMATNVLECELDYLFEGDMLLPDQAAELMSLGEGAVRVCFMGYADIDPDRKFGEIRRHQGLPNDWLNEHDDDYVIEVVEYGIDFSRRISRRCEALGIRYFDGSKDFDGAIDDDVDYLIE